MRKIILPLLAVSAALFTAGCAGPEHKLSRGIDNTLELVRWGDLRHSVEEEGVFSGPDYTYTYGLIHGFDRSISRAGLGIFEVVTFPIPTPTYGPLCTNSVPIVPQEPDSYKPGLVADPLFETDTYTGYTGGDVAPFIPGSRFRIFDN